MNNWRTAMAATIALLGSAAAPAAVIERTFDFRGTGFARVFANGTPPIDTIDGSFTLRFDNAVSVQDATEGLTVNSLSFAPASPLGYDYDATSDLLKIGALEASVDGIMLESNDFFLSIAAASGAFSYTFLGYSAGTGYFGTRTIAAGAIPEPASWATMLCGFGMLGGALRRRKVRVRLA